MFTHCKTCIIMPMLHNLHSDTNIKVCRTDRDKEYFIKSERPKGYLHQARTHDLCINLRIVLTCITLIEYLGQCIVISAKYYCILHSAKRKI